MAYVITLSQREILELILDLLIKHTDKCCVIIETTPLHQFVSLSVHAHLTGVMNHPLTGEKPAEHKSKRKL